MTCLTDRFLLVQPPFFGGNRNKIQQKIVKDKIKLPGYLTSEAHSLLKEVYPYIFVSSLLYAYKNELLKFLLVESLRLSINRL